VSGQRPPRGSWFGKSAVHISANTRLTSLRGSNFLRLLPIFDIGIRSIPLNNISQFVSQRHGAAQEPAIFPLSPAKACSSLDRFPSRHSRAPRLHQLRRVLALNSHTT